MSGTIIQRLGNLEKLVKDIKLLIEQRVLNGLALEGAMDGVIHDLHAKERGRSPEGEGVPNG